VTGFTHDNVELGESRQQRHKGSPILSADGYFDAANVCEKFSVVSKNVPDAIGKFVIEKLRAHPGFVVQT
jgi:hypothetical protein